MAKESKNSKWTKLDISVDLKLQTQLTRTVLTEKYNAEKARLAEMREFFLSKIDGCELFKHDDYSYVFYIKIDKNNPQNNEVLMEQDDKNKYFYIKYTNFWSVFESQYRCNYAEIQSFTQSLLEWVSESKGYKKLYLDAYAIKILEWVSESKGYKTSICSKQSRSNLEWVSESKGYKTWYNNGEAALNLEWVSESKGYKTAIETLASHEFD